MKPKKEIRKGFSTIDQSIQEYLKEFQLKARFDQSHLITYWEDLVGKTIAKRTKRVYFKNDVLIIEVSSAPMRATINQSKADLMKLIQEKYGTEMVADILII